MNIGLHEGIPSPEYHKVPAVSQSLLRVMRDKSPAHVRHTIDNPGPQTEPMMLGEAIHCAILEPDRFEAQYVRGPEGDARTKAYKAELEAMQAERPDAIYLRPAQWSMVIATRNAVRNHPTAQRVFGGEAERSAFWQDAGTGLICKARFDDIKRKAGRALAIVDLKTTTDASPQEFQRSMWKWGYYLQAFHYLEGARAVGLDAQHFVIVAVERDAPHGVAVYTLLADPLERDAVEKEYRRLLNRWAECEKSGAWPSYPTKAVTLRLPAWAEQQMMEEE